MTALRVLLPEGDSRDGGVLGDLATEPDRVLDALAARYAYPDPVPGAGWVRANMVATLDGAATGPDHRSGSISDDVDRAVFRLLRALADVVVVGAGTARTEGYRSPGLRPEFAARRPAGLAPVPALAVLTRSGDLPEPQALFPGPGAGFVVTCASADVAGLVARFGAERVLVAGTDDVDPVGAVARLVERGLPRVLLEGGPRLLGRTLAAGRLDELCLTWSPLLVGGPGPRIVHGASVGALRARPAHLIQAGDVLLGRWLVEQH